MMWSRENGRESEKVEKNFMQANFSTSNEEKRWRIRTHRRRHTHTTRRGTLTTAQPKQLKPKTFPSSKVLNQNRRHFPLIIYRQFFYFVRILLHRGNLISSMCPPICERLVSTDVYSISNGKPFTVNEYWNHFGMDFPKCCSPKIPPNT